MLLFFFLDNLTCGQFADSSFLEIWEPVQSNFANRTDIGDYEFPETIKINGIDTDDIDDVDLFDSINNDVYDTVISDGDIDGDYDGDFDGNYDATVVFRFCMCHFPCLSKSKTFDFSIILCSEIKNGKFLQLRNINVCWLVYILVFFL